MTNYGTRKKSAIALILICAMMLTGCDPSGIITHLESKYVGDEEARENPLFWDDATPVPKSSNLYTLSGDNFLGKPYIDLARLGDHILMVGQAAYSTKKIVVQDLTDEDYKLSFDLYSPWSNSILASLPYDELDCDGYCVLGSSKLLLFSKTNNLIWIYDDKLELVGTFEVNGISTDFESIFYMGDNNTIYANSVAGDYIYSIQFPDEISSPEQPVTLNAKPVKTDFFQHILSPKLVAQSKDESKLIITGIDSNSMRQSIWSYRASDDSAQLLVESIDTYIGSVYDDDYILCTSFSDECWKYVNSDENNYFFEARDITDATIFADHSYVLNQKITSEDKPTKCNGIYYKEDGTVRSSFSFSKKACELTSCAFFEADNLAFYFIYQENSDPQLLVWDLSDAGKKKDPITCYDNFYELECTYRAKMHEKDPEMYPIYSNFYDDGSYDWGDLTECRELANKLEKQYNIEIYLGEEVPNQIDVFNVATMTHSDTTMNALKQFQKILALYPDNFFQQLMYGNLSSLRFYFAGTLSSNADGMLSEAGAFVTQLGQCKLMVIDCNFVWDMSYTLNHEFSHMIDSRLDYRSVWSTMDALYSETKWASYNPEGFEYSYDYSDYTSYEPYYTYAEYFVDAYGTTYPTEDRAELFGEAANYAVSDDPDFILTYYFNDTRLKKLKYYCSCIRDGFDTTDWPAVMPWEKILKTH